MTAVPSSQTNVLTFADRTSLESALLSELFKKGPHATQAGYEKDLGLAPGRSAADRELVVFKALHNLATRTAESKSAPDLVLQLAVEWESALSLVLKIHGGDMTRAGRYAPLRKAMESAVIAPHGEAALEACFVEMGFLAPGDGPPPRERQLAFQVLRSIPPRTEVDQELEDAFAPDPVRPVLAGFGSILASRAVRGGEAAFEFVARELTGKGIDLDAADREVVLFYAIRETGQQTSKAFQSADAAAQRATVRQWEGIFQVIERANGRSTIIQNPGRAMRGALQSLHESHEIEALEKAWRRVKDSRYRKLAHSLMEETLRPLDRAA